MQSIRLGAFAIFQVAVSGYRFLKNTLWGVILTVYCWTLCFIMWDAIFRFFDYSK